MSTYHESYCNTTTDLTFIEPNISEYDGKKVLASNFTTTDTSNLYQLNNTGFIDQLFKDGVEMTSVTDTPNADNEYNYSASTDSVQFFLASSSVSALFGEPSPSESGSKKLGIPSPSKSPSSI